MKNNKKRELYFSMMAICLLGIYIFLESDLLGINVNIFIRILFCIIFLMLFLELNYQINKLGKEKLNGAEIDFKLENVKKFIKQNYELISNNSNASFSVEKYKGLNNSEKLLLIVIKLKDSEFKIKNVINDCINWYKYKYLKKIQLFDKNYDLKIICFCDDYGIDYVSNIYSQIYLRVGRGAPNAIVIPVFISTLKKKAYLSGIRYLRKIEFDYYQKEKNELIKILNDKKGDVVDEKEY